MTETRSPSYPFFSRIVLAIALLLLAVETVDYINFTVDDVFISMRVAENAAHGQGFVYNAGENVEGYSDPLWVWMLTGAAKLGISSEVSPLALMWFAKGMSYLFGLLTIAVLYVLVKKIYRNSNFASLYASFSVLVSVMTAPFIAWSIGGLEMTLVSFLFMMSAYFAYGILKSSEEEKRIPAREYFAFSLCYILASLARPESPMFAIAGFVFLFLVIRKHERKKFIISAILPYIASMLIFFWWRWTTYHDVLPNSFYVKTGGGLRSYMMGVKYLLGALGALAVPLGLFILFAFLRNWRTNRLKVYLFMMIATSIVFVIYSGGDWMPGARFLIPVAPFFFLLAVLGFSELHDLLMKSGKFLQPSKVIFMLVVVVVSFTCSFSGRNMLRGELPSMPTGFASHPGYAELSHQQVGDWLLHNTHGAITVAAGEAGLIGYMNSQMRLLDLNGLMDKHIAGMRKQGKPYDAEYIFLQHPQYIILYGTDNPNPTAAASGNYLQAIGRSPHLLNEYSLVQRFPHFEIYARNGLQ